MLHGVVAAQVKPSTGIEGTFMLMSKVAVTKQVMAQPNAVYTYTFDHPMLNAVNSTVVLTYLAAPTIQWTGP